MTYDGFGFFSLNLLTFQNVIEYEMYWKAKFVSLMSDILTDSGT